ncbi:hypothetical protein K440DRAFT_662308 [Wilcoxina mikolae CBS 423.85]|nr:hypothetical protein K440DRAFT_662308 [Wilcoxina mikolae CBS 423.85]
MYLPSSSRGKLTDRFGIYQPVVLISSTFGIILVIGALSVLWTWTLNDNPEGLRSKIALAGWTVSAIAICSALLRTCVVVQLATACMVVATLAFEKNYSSVLLQDAATMSIYRYAASSPYAMILPMIRGTLVSKKPLGIMLLMLLSVETILSQFISTILLSDTGLGHIAESRRNMTLGYDSTDFKASANPLLEQKPQVFPWFLEKTAKSFTISHGPTGPGLSDTGPTVRALIPLPNPQRSSLLYYHGTAPVIDSHVLCVAPNLTRFEYHLEDDYMGGNLTVPLLEEVLASGELEKRGSFRKSNAKLGNFWFGCQADQYNTQDIYCVIVLQDYEGTNRWDSTTFPADSVLQFDNNWWLVVRYNSTEFDWLKAPSPERIDSMSRLFNEKGFKFNGTEWITKSVTGHGNTKRSLEITLCVSTFRVTNTNLELKLDTNITDPQVGQVEFLTVPDIVNYNTTLVQNLFGGNNLSHRERGIASLPDYTVNKSSHFWIPAKFPSLFTNTMAVVPMSNAHPIYASIFRDTIRKTKSAAFALQSVFTLLTVNGYYDRLDALAITNVSTVQFVHPAIVPQTKRGLYIVCGIVVLHFTTMAVIFSLYFRSSAPKFLDQAWQTIGQLHCGEAKEFLRDTADLCDRDVGRLPPAAAKWNTLVEISKRGKPVIECQTTSSSLQVGNLGPISLPIQQERTPRHTAAVKNEREDREGAVLIRGAEAGSSPISPIVRRKGPAHSTTEQKEGSGGRQAPSNNEWVEVEGAELCALSKDSEPKARTPETGVQCDKSCTPSVG